MCCNNKCDERAPPVPRCILQVHKRAELKTRPRLQVKPPVAQLRPVAVRKCQEEQ